MDEMGSEFDFESPDDYEAPMSIEDEAQFLEASLIGKGSNTFDILSNEVTIHTLTLKETMQAAELVKNYRNTDAHIVATKTAFAAASIDSINGIPFYVPISIDDPIIPGKFKKLSENYYAYFANEVYKKYRELEDEQQEIIEKLKKAQA